MSDDPEDSRVRRHREKRRHGKGQSRRGRVAVALSRDLEGQRTGEIRADDLRERRFADVGIAGQPVEQFAENGRAAPPAAEDQDGWKRC